MSNQNYGPQEPGREPQEPMQQPQYPRAQRSAESSGTRMGSAGGEYSPQPPRAQRSAESSGTPPRAARGEQYPQSASYPYRSSQSGSSFSLQPPPHYQPARRAPSSSQGGESYYGHPASRAQSVDPSPDRGGGQPLRGESRSVHTPARSGTGGLGKWVVIGVVALMVGLVVVWALNRPEGGSAGTAATATPTANAGDLHSEQPDGQSTGGVAIDALGVGQCIQLVAIEGAGHNPDDQAIPVTHQVVDCGLAGEFKLVVASSTVGEATCPNEDYVRYRQTGTDGTRLTLCLAPAFEVNRCYASDPLKEWIDTPCDDPVAFFRIEAEHTPADPGLCPSAEGAFVLPEPDPGRVYCIGPKG